MPSNQFDLHFTLPEVPLFFDFYFLIENDGKN